MLQALLQTIANLGLDSETVNQTFNNILSTIRSGDTSSVDGVMGVFRGLLSVVTGVDATDVSMIVASVVTSMLQVLSNAGASNVLSTITGA